jgi:hypothetical protein
MVDCLEDPWADFRITLDVHMENAVDTIGETVDWAVRHLGKQLFPISGNLLLGN